MNKIPFGREQLTNQTQFDSVREIATRLAAVREGGEVERCHTVPHIGEYKNGQHSWGVAMIVAILWPEHFSRLGLIALTHDVPERYVGDIPAQVLRANPLLRETVLGLEREVTQRLGIPFEMDLTEEEYQIFKAADRLELYLWCLEQMRRGNMEVVGIINQLHEIWAKQPLPEPAKSLVDYTTFVGWERLPETIKELT